MKNRQSQNGSAHLIIIIISAVALLGLLGFVCYRNFIQPKITDQNITTNKVNSDVASSLTSNTTKAASADEIALTEVASDQANGTGFAIRYPKTWSLVHETIPASGLVYPDDSNTITSPDKTTSVILKSFSATGRWLACWDNGNENAKVTVNDKADISTYPKAGFINYSESTNGDYIGAYNISTVKDNQGCRAYTDSRYLLGYDSQNLVTLQAKFTGAADINSDNYKIAKRIIQSLYTKD